MYQQWAFCMVTVAQAHELMADGNIIIQAVVLGLFIVAIFIERKKKFVWHGNIMLVAVVISGLLLVMHMGPTFINVVRDGTASFDWVAYFGMAHGILGTVAWGLAIWLTVAWALQDSQVGYCMMRSKWMLRILTLWVVSLGLGYVYYVVHIVWS